MSRPELTACAIALIALGPGQAPLRQIFANLQDSGEAQTPAPRLAPLTPQDRELVELIRFMIAEQDLDGARGLLAEVVGGLGAPAAGSEAERITLLFTLESLADSLGSLPDLLALRRARLELRARLLPADHPDVLAAKQDLGATSRVLGDYAAARELEEAVLEARARSLATDHPDLLAAKLNLGATLSASGEHAAARATFEEVLAVWRRLLPADDPNVLAVMQNLAATKRELGDLAGARELLEAVHVARVRQFPPDHREVLLAKQNLAVSRRDLGDLIGARELEEVVLRGLARVLPSGHPDLLGAKQNLANTKLALGDPRGAHELYEQVLEARTRLHPPDHPYVLAARQNLAVTMKRLGDPDGAREHEEAVLEALSRAFPPDHPGLLTAKQNLGVTRARSGQFDEARALFEEVVAARRQLLPSDHPELLDAELCLAGSRKDLGDLEGARELVPSMLAGMRARVRALQGEGVRTGRERAREELRNLSFALSLCEHVDPERVHERELFETLESLRLASVASAEVAQALAEHPELAEDARAVAGIRARLNDLATAGAEAGEVESWRTGLVDLAEQRDGAERALRSKLARIGAFVGEVDAAALGARLPGGSAVVSFLRYMRRFERDPETGVTPTRVESVLAFVLLSDGAVRRLELGRAAELEALVRDWLAALGEPIERGVAVVPDGPRTEAELGRALFARTLAPVLAAAGEGVHTLHVVLDDVLFLVPLDALPIEGEVRVGERLRIHVEPDLARLLRDERPLASGGTLVALGGIDFEAEAIAATSTSGESDRSGRPERFEPLRQTSYEVEDVAAQFRAAFGGEPRILSGAEASKAALFEAAPGTRFLHLATHGWFASESAGPRVDGQDRDALLAAEQTRSGFAPETLCGLALAGANRGADALGRMPGILTAEELASLDLRQCELAVLSACETNAGIRRAGQGIQSLQTALHSAGARSAITAPWKVDDAATRRLFELFYAKLWTERLPKHEALWRAKMALRAEGHPARDWSAWVLSGDPD